MSKTFKSQETVISELSDLFQIQSNVQKGTYRDKTSFYISKLHMSRMDVLDKLKNYFRGVVIKDGYLSVSSITFVCTTFEVCNGHPAHVGN